MDALTLFCVVLTSNVASQAMSRPLLKSSSDSLT
jgi:hypothetical protein